MFLLHCHIDVTQRRAPKVVQLTTPAGAARGEGTACLTARPSQSVMRDEL